MLEHFVEGAHYFREPTSPGEEFWADRDSDCALEAAPQRADPAAYHPNTHGH